MTSGNTGRSRTVPLCALHTAVLGDYTTALEHAPLADSTKAKYVSRLRGYLAWLAGQAGALDGDPLADPVTATRAVRDFRRHLKNGRRAPNTIDGYLSALDDFYTRRGLGKPRARRERDVRRTAPRALDAHRYIRHVQLIASPRDKALALLPCLAGLRISEVVGLDVADVRLSARKAELRIRGKGRDGGKIRLLPVHPDLRQALTDWLEARAGWEGAGSTAVFLNHRGGRLSDRAARDIITGLGDAVGLNDDPAEPFSPSVLRHTFATQLIRDGKNPILVAELLGHGSLDTTRRYALLTEADREAALDALIADRWTTRQESPAGA
ncbi:tyrosine-type recombinase/integrase [Planomonospora venezuelensis]|uniref:Integrase/recombinase XerC n=1 Tax=Planomonospora venezuelensis TaxID=1999 RepID=A0A841DFK5_PLAVE|nr:tyrosine-type recombinase/integrase [Planomonospora venezuelensis]MBB5967174.1 integrase/recombinase XerC [Planomonospora venezuelensis]